MADAPLPRWDRPDLGWVAPALAAIAWSGLQVSALSLPLPEQRTLGFVAGPVLLLAGIHARTAEFLHTRERSRLLPLPIESARHWREAARHHRRGLLLTAMTASLGLILVGLSGALTGRAGEAWMSATRLGLDFLLLVGLAALIEPLFAGVSAHLGRRFPQKSPAHETQRSLGGGWTQPEAVVHLYAPAFAIATAAALAMPAQLALARLDTHGGLEAQHWALALGPVLPALAGPWLGRRLYARGVWEAVPWLAEATRTLAGPPTPEEAPAWVTRIRDPHRRLLVLQFIRLTPLPMLRLAAVLGFGLVPWIWVVRPTPQSVAAGLVLAGLWVLPARRLVATRAARQRLLVALPLSRRAGPEPGALSMLLMPPAVAGALALTAWVVGS